jgi:transcriptional regulator with XRE-family HTH domain
MKKGPALAKPRLVRPSGSRFVGPLLALLVPGTGGAYLPEGIAQLERWAHQSAIEVRPRLHDADVDARSVMEHVRNIRDSFALNMSELASVLNVSRPTAYAWLNGQAPQPDALARIYRLSRTADRFAGIGIARPETAIRQPVFGGASLLELLRSNADVSDAIARLSRLAASSKATRYESKASGKRLRPSEQVSELATPATHEPT